MSATHDQTRPVLIEDQFACPRCHNGILEAVTDGSETNFLCHGCWTCWHVELGYMAPVPDRSPVGSSASSSEGSLASARAMATR